MKKRFCALLCALLILSGCTGNTDSDGNDAILPIPADYTEAQCAALVFGTQNLTVSFRGNRVLGGIVADVYTVMSGSETLGSVALGTDGTKYADADNSGVFRTLSMRGEDAVMGDAIVPGEDASRYLRWEGNVSALPTGAKENFEGVFDAVYAEMCRAYGKTADKQSVTIRVETCGDGMVWDGQAILLDPNYLSDHVNGYDALTEQLFYAVSGLDAQDEAHGWLIRGLSLFCHTRYGVYNEYNRYTIQYNAEDSVSDSPERTAVFLSWVSETFDWEFTTFLCRTLQEGTYEADSIWFDRIGFELDELWQLYLTMCSRADQRNPASPWEQYGASAGA